MLAVALIVLAACAAPALSPAPPEMHPARVACPPGGDDPTAPLGLPRLPAAARCATRWTASP
ncbi:hypothetical protein ACQP2P_19800 [Dactylosporangium sp. CA-139114]|uniref:hypothetical protein n=1 Tax=Dactylosporangium sp. CA-139114 TaxID=3239931 RepID=UPI003D9919A9